MKTAYIIAAIGVVGVLAYLVFGRNRSTTGTGFGQTTGGETGGFFNTFGKDFGFAGPASGQTTADWIAQRNAQEWSFNTKLL